MSSTSSEVDVHAAAFVVALLRAGFLEEAREFTEWFLETFDREIQSLPDGAAELLDG